jgi:nucleotide-binding universal stress UspA family protein
MLMPHKILVPVDFSGSSRAALEYAAVLGSRFGADVDVLHVWHPSHRGESNAELLDEFTRSEEGKKMMEWLATFEVRGDVAAHGCLMPGVRSDVPDAIIEVVKSREYDLIVMATHARHGLSLLKWGGVTEKVMRRAPCPVVTIPADENDENPPAEPDPLDPAVMGPWLWPS